MQTIELQLVHVKVKLLTDTKIEALTGIGKEERNLSCKCQLLSKSTRDGQPNDMYSSKGRDMEDTEYEDCRTKEAEQL